MLAAVGLDPRHLPCSLWKGGVFRIHGGEVVPQTRLDLCAVVSDLSAVVSATATAACQQCSERRGKGHEDKPTAKRTLTPRHHNVIVGGR